MQARQKKPLGGVQGKERQKTGQDKGLDPQWCPPGGQRVQHPKHHLPAPHWSPPHPGHAGPGAPHQASLKLKAVIAAWVPSDLINRRAEAW